jgi:protease-4
MVKSVVMVFNSPGGTASGTDEVAQDVADLAKVKPVTAYADTLMASAAYYLAAPSNAIFASPSSIVGSIGTIRTVASMSRMLESMGIDVDLITSGKWKAAGHPAKELTKDEKAMFQEQVDGYGNDFRAWVSGHRSKIDLDDMEGQTFQGKDAASRGFVDFTASSLEDVLDMIGDPLR